MVGGSLMIHIMTLVISFSANFRNYQTVISLFSAIQSPQKRRLKKGAVPSTCLPVRTHERRAGPAQLRAQEARAKRAATRQDVPRESLQSLSII